MPKTKNQRKRKSHVFKIESGIPIPPAHSGREAAFPFLKLKVGESFFVPASVRSRKPLSISAHNAVNRLRKSGFKIKIAVRYLPEEKGTRIWRVK